MSVEVIHSQHLRVEFEAPSAWTLWISHRNGGKAEIELGLHWKDKDIPSHTKILVEGSKEYNTFKEFLRSNAESNTFRTASGRVSD